MPESPTHAADRARYTEALTPKQRQARLDRVAKLNIIPVPLRTIESVRSYYERASK